MADTDEQKLAPATQPDAAGALVEPDILRGVDTAHPAVDDNPRQGVPEHSNRIDFNDPNLSGADAVQQNLEAQGADAAKTTAKASAPKVKA